MIIHQELAFGTDEYQDRIRKLRRKMTQRELDVLLLCNPVSTKYIAGYQTQSVAGYQCLAVPMTGDPAMLVWELELPGVALTSWVKDATMYRTGENPFLATRRLLESRGFHKGMIGLEKDARYLTPLDYEQLTSALRDCRIGDGSGLVRELLRVKSSPELVCLREAAKFTAAGMQAAINVTAAGVLDNEVAAAAHQALIAAGSEFPCSSVTVTTGRRSGIPHTTHHRTRIASGDAVLIEMGGCYERYTAPLMRTVFVGPPPSGARELADASLAALDAVMATVKPDITGDEVAQRVSKLLPLDDASIVFHHTYGYSVGLGFPPTWADDPSLTLIRGNRIPIEPGMVFHSTMSLRRRAQYGVAVSETLVVTETGCESLTTFPRRYFFE